MDNLEQDAMSWYSRAQIDEIRRQAIIDSGGIQACKCGSTPTLHGDGATPDDGYRDLWCYGCMEHVTDWHRSASEAISAWNDRREIEISTPHAIAVASWEAAGRPRDLGGK